METSIYNKAAAVALLLLLIAGLWLVAAAPYIESWQVRLALAERQQRKLDALERLIEDREHFEQQYRAVSESRALQDLFLGDKAGALADTRLQGIVKQAVADSGGRLLQAVIVKNGGGSREESGIDKSVTVKVLMQGSIESIYSMLRELENNLPLITVSNLQITHQKARSPVTEQVSATSYRASYDATAFIL